MVTCLNASPSPPKRLKVLTASVCDAYTQLLCWLFYLHQLRLWLDLTINNKTHVTLQYSLYFLTSLVFKTIFNGNLKVIALFLYLLKGFCVCAVLFWGGIHYMDPRVASLVVTLPQLCVLGLQACSTTLVIVVLLSINSSFLNRNT